MKEIDFDRYAEEHVRDVTTGRLPPGDVASNIAEDLRRAYEEGRKACIGTEREGIARYFDHLAIVRIGVVDLGGMPAREMYSCVASWVRNRLDEKWAEKVRSNEGEAL